MSERERRENGCGHHRSATLTNGPTLNVNTYSHFKTHFDGRADTNTFFGIGPQSLSHLHPKLDNASELDPALFMTDSGISKQNHLHWFKMAALACEEAKSTRC